MSQQQTAQASDQNGDLELSSFSTPSSLEATSTRPLPTGQYVRAIIRPPNWIPTPINNPSPMQQSRLIRFLFATWLGNAIAGIGLLAAIATLGLTAYSSIIQIQATKWSMQNEALQSCLAAYPISRLSAFCNQTIKSGVSTPPVLATIRRQGDEAIMYGGSRASSDQPMSKFPDGGNWNPHDWEDHLWGRVCCPTLDPHIWYDVSLAMNESCEQYYEEVHYYGHEEDMTWKMVLTAVVGILGLVAVFRKNVLQLIQRESAQRQKFQRQAGRRAVVKQGMNGGDPRDVEGLKDHIEAPYDPLDIALTIFIVVVGLLAFS